MKKRTEMGMEVQAGAVSNVGRVRTHNEDAYVLGNRLWAVADGMGGQAAGDVASRIAVRCLEERDGRGPVDQSEIQTVISRMNQEIMAYGGTHPQAVGLGTTVAGAALTDLGGQCHWVVFHIGDSRVYRLSRGRFTMETTDHSEVQELVDAGRVSRAEARNHPRRNVLTRWIGSPQEPKADVRLLPCAPGDRLVICSDGLTGEVGDEAIEQILAAASSPSDTAATLVDAALSHGGHDNITAVVLRVGGGEETDPHGVERTLSRRDVVIGDA